MSFVKQITDTSKYSSLDSVDAGKNFEVTEAGFGYVDSTGTFIVLDAMPLGRQSTQLAVEAGSAATVAALSDSDAKVQFAAINFATADYVTATEVDASAAMDSELLTSDLT